MIMIMLIAELTYRINFQKSREGRFIMAGFYYWVGRVFWKEQVHFQGEILSSKFPGKGFSLKNAV